MLSGTLANADTVNKIPTILVTGPNIPKDRPVDLGSYFSEPNLRHLLRGDLGDLEKCEGAEAACLSFPDTKPHTELVFLKSKRILPSWFSFNLFLRDEVLKYSDPQKAAIAVYFSYGFRNEIKRGVAVMYPYTEDERSYWKGVFYPVSCTGHAEAASPA
jgi:hypothetical protein